MRQIPVCRKEWIYYVLASLCLAAGALALTVYTAVRFTGFLLCAAAGVLTVLGLLSRLSKTHPWARWARRIALGLLAAGLRRHSEKVLKHRIVKKWVVSAVAAVLLLARSHETLDRHNAVDGRFGSVYEIFLRNHATCHRGLLGTCGQPGSKCEREENKLFLHRVYLSYDEFLCKNNQPYPISLSFSG